MRPKPTPAVLLLAALLSAGAAAADAAVDPFYQTLLRDGQQAYERKDYAAAARELRLACFGMLEEPATLADCLTRKVAAFPAVDKLTKPAWLAMLLVAGLFGSWISPSPTGPISMISAVVAAVYLVDVRPAVREISGGRR